MRKTKCFVVSTKHLNDLEQIFNEEVSKLEYNGWEVMDAQYIKDRDYHSYSVIVVKDAGTEKGKKPFVKPELIEVEIPKDPFICRGNKYVLSSSEPKEFLVRGNIVSVEELLAEKLVNSSRQGNQLFINYLLKDILGGE